MQDERRMDVLVCGCCSFLGFVLDRKHLYITCLISLNQMVSWFCWSANGFVGFVMTVNCKWQGKFLLG
jgi:hypothetical protein